MNAEEMQEIFLKQTRFENVKTADNEMSPKERFYAIMDYQKFDRIIDTEFGYWDDTLRRWHEEGLPQNVDSNEKADIYFGFDEWMKSVPVKTGILPEFEEEIVEKNDKYIIKYDQRKIKCQVFTNGKDTIPHYLDFPLKDKDSYKIFKERYLPQIHKRIPENAAEIGRLSKSRNYILNVFMGSTAGWIRDLMGFEGFSTSILLNPELIDEILDDLTTLYTALAGALNEHLEIDIAAWWEDIAFKSGPITPPDFFSNKCGPVYKKTMDILRKNGTRFGYVDCDGDMSLLVSTWINNGINIMFPLEVNSGIHPQDLRKKFSGIRMMGGFDKKILMEENSKIKNELCRLKELTKEGGFIPHVDHRVQSDVPFSNYIYYLEAKRDIFEIPNTINKEVQL